MSWSRALLGAGMLATLVLCFVPALVLYTLVFGVGAASRLFDFSANRVSETL